MNIYRKKHENFTQKEKKRLSQSILLYLTVLKALKYPHLSMCVCVVSLVTTEALYPQS